MAAVSLKRAVFHVPRGARRLIQPHPSSPCQHSSACPLLLQPLLSPSLSPAPPSLSLSGPECSLAPSASTDGLVEACAGATSPLFGSSAFAVARHEGRLPLPFPDLPWPCSRGAMRFTSLAADLATLPDQVPPTEPSEPQTSDLTPAKVVEQLDRYIVGQSQAKKAVAIALRNRWRRRRIEGVMKAEIVPKNILMIGPTGCGKTEIARRLAKLMDAPFVKVEATKFTEVGFHGRDVDQIIRDLLENAIQLQRSLMKAKLAAGGEIDKIVENKILDALVGVPAADLKEPFAFMSDPEAKRRLESHGTRETFRSLLQQGKLEERKLQLEVPVDMPHPASSSSSSSSSSFSSASSLADIGGAGFMDHLSKMAERAFRGQRTERRYFSVAEAREVLTVLETERALSSENVIKEAIQMTESDGIVFLDEIDKIVSSAESRHGADASAEGVQRDLLPIIEGSIVSTRHGNVNTEHILFICSGAFHSVKPSDMLAELQGRLPIRVELKGLTQQDLYRILTEPETNMIRQQQLLLATEGVSLSFTKAALDTVASTAAEVNRSLQNIGARRLHTVLERVMEDISFTAPERRGESIVIDKEDVEASLGDLVQRTDLSQYIL